MGSVHRAGVSKEGSLPRAAAWLELLMIIFWSSHYVYEKGAVLQREGVKPE